MGVRALWGWDDPAGSETRFREAAAAASGTEREVLLTQMARALGLQDRFAEGHAGLDRLLVDALHMVALVAGPGDQVRVTPEALAVARGSAEPEARRWEASC